jgi:ABC-2 type transport system ATP-binding protein
MLGVDRLTVRFGSFTAVDGISFRVEPGEIFGFLGPNGAGKTTTIKVLTGQIRPSSGSASLAGRNLWESFEDLKPLFGYVADFDNHLEELSAARNLSLFCLLYGIPADRALAALDTVELRNEKDQKVKNFSKGMKKKLMIAREILHAPRLLYLDEPTANLDVHSTAVIRALLKELAGRGTSVFCTTHNMEEAEELCDRIAILDQGRIVGLDTPDGFKRKYAEPVLRVVLRKGPDTEVRWVHLAAEDDRAFLAERVRDGEVVAIDSHRASFKEVFLKLTGREFR